MRFNLAECCSCCLQVFKVADAVKAALRALTSVPANIFGTGSGRLEQGARADLVLWSGDPLEVTTAADLLILGGRRVIKQSRQTLLRDRYLPRDPVMPRAYPAR